MTEERDPEFDEDADLDVKNDPIPEDDPSQPTTEDPT